MSIKVIASVLGKEYNLGEVDSRSFSMGELVRKLKEVRRMKIECVKEINIYARLPGGNEVSEITNCAELVGIIALFDELGEDKLCLKVDYAVTVHESDEEEFSNYVESKDVDHIGKGTCEGIRLNSASDNHSIDIEVRDEDRGNGNRSEQFCCIDLGENERHTNIGTWDTQFIGFDVGDNDGFNHEVEATVYNVGAEADDEAHDDTDFFINYQINSYDSEESIGANSDAIEDVSKGLWSDIGNHTQSIQKSTSEESRDDASSRYWGMIKGGIITTKSDGNIMLCKDKHSRFLDIIDGPSPVFEVLEGSTHYVVNLDSKDYGCGAWQLFGYPCKHVMKVLNYMRMPAGDYVHHYLTQEYYLRTYGSRITPIPDEPLWPDLHNIEELHPPPVKKKPGRPKQSRRKEISEYAASTKRSVVVRCGICKLGQGKAIDGASGSQLSIGNNFQFKNCMVYLLMPK
ncbi:protein FAR1-RELATED SEQUENCE 5-like [Melia azedarach]|uniref:Protein FAR1-RELATED SEQUENCE 5-like n=1 Tax=Melia azedarach TaxID=155640 RepID=A0ACC1YWD4_MELAZ|nr:protein FAR1-RELATED SEQUENCE 5-like [Melia azedarach]